MTASNGGPVTDAAFSVEQVDKELRKRTCWLHFMAIVYSLALSGLLYLAYEVYDLQADQAKEDAEKLTQPGSLKVIDFNDIAVSSDHKTFIAVGDRGSILVYSRDGEVRREHTLAGGIRADLQSIAFSGNGKRAIAAGDDGALLLSNDRGKSWNRVRSNTEHDFTRVVVSKNGRVAVAVGDRGLIRVSRDGGRSWHDPGNVTPKRLNDVAVSDDGSIIVVAGDDSTMLVYNDARPKWSTKTKEAKQDFVAVAFHGNGDYGKAVAVGDDDAIFVSCDGGERWSQFRPKQSKIAKK